MVFGVLKSNGVPSTDLFSPSGIKVLSTGVKWSAFSLSKWSLIVPFASPARLKNLPGLIYLLSPYR